MLLRILLIVHQLLPGGTETHVLSLATELRALGHHVGLYTHGGPWLPHFRNAGVRIHLQSSFVQPSPNAQYQLAHVIRQHRYQIIHAHDNPSFRLVGASNLPTSTRVVMTVHGNYATRLAVLACSRKARRIIAVSPAVRYRLIHSFQLSGGRVQVVPNGINLKVFQPKSEQRNRLRSRFRISDSAFVVGYAGRFTFSKRIVSLRVCRVLANYAKLRPNVHVMVAGVGSRQALSVYKNKHYHVLGAITGMTDFYHAADVVIGTGRVALEAACCRRPTIAVGNARHIGRLTSTNISQAFQSNFGDDGPIPAWTDAQLIDGVASVRQDSRDAQKIATAVRVVVGRDFSIRGVVSKVLKIYRV